MKKLWSCPLKEGHSWFVPFDGRFIGLENENYVYYIYNPMDYERRDCVRFVKVDFNGVLLEEKDFFPSQRVTIPNCWETTEFEDHTILICDENGRTAFYIDKDEVRMYEHGEYADLLRGDIKRRSEGPYFFDDLRIDQVSPFKYCCIDLKTNEKLWAVVVKGYIYADMVIIRSKLFICTAEHGGYVHAIDIHTGEILYSIDTHGTAKIIFGGERFYCYMHGKKGSVISVDIDTGAVLEREELFITTIDCPFKRVGNYLLTMSFELLPTKKKVPGCEIYGGPGYFTPWIMCYDITDC